MTRSGSRLPCRKKEFSVLLMDRDDELYPKLEGHSNKPNISLTQETTPKVSLNSIIGLSSSKTMKLLVMIQHVVIMIDPGETYKFISLEIVEKLGIPMMESSGFGVSLGNGKAVHGSAI